MKKVLIKQFYGDSTEARNYIIFPPTKPGVVNSSHGFPRMVPIHSDNGTFEDMLADAILQWGEFEKSAASSEYVATSEIYLTHPSGEPWTNANLMDGLKALSQ